MISANMSLSCNYIFLCLRLHISQYSFSLFYTSNINFKAVNTNYQAPTLTVSMSGESVTLQCSVQGIASSCVDEQSVYWFNHDSEKSHSGIIYTHGNSSVQCERSSKADFPTQSCIYTLLKSNLKPVEKGIYYCAVAACGTILLGNGTKLNVKGK